MNKYNRALTYNSRPDSLIDALESQHAIAQVLVLSIFVEEGTANCQKPPAGPFANDMVKEVFHR